MKANGKLLLLVPLTLWLGAAATTASAQAAPKVTLDQAVTQVQRETGGRILSAEPRLWERRQEYRIKVLTPEGHVRVMTISSEGDRNTLPPQSTRNPPGRRAGGKEKH